MRSIKIGIIGLGIVGKAVDHGMKKNGHSTVIHDIKLDTNIKDILDSEICYLCVPTPSLKSGTCDTSIVETVIEELNSLKYSGELVIKSTVIPGTTESMAKKFPNLKLSFVPEFLRERCAIIDFVDNHDICIIGTNSIESYALIKESHGSLPQKFIKTNPREAELCKYFNNIYNATLITFANSFYEICEKLEVDYSNVKNAIINRKHINDSYLDCNDNFRGFGGVCLPKDTKAINQLCSTLNIDVNFFKNIIDENDKYLVTVPGGMRKD